MLVVTTVVLSRSRESRSLRVVPAAGGAHDGSEQIVRLEFQLARYVVRAAILHVAEH